ncbi:hypothetical protein MMC17_008105 [Xylographa soralifera]|nr:hypothetical protein [Xylographa soralifera]
MLWILPTVLTYITPRTLRKTSSVAHHRQLAYSSTAAMTTIIDPNTWYRITNVAIGTSTALDVINTGSSSTQGPLQLDGTANVSGQFWHIVLQPSCKYYLSTMFLGPGITLSNALFQNNTVPYLKPIEQNPPDPSQQWTLIPQGYGEYKLTNDGVGSDLFMDVCGSAGGLCFQSGDMLGQDWALAAIGIISPSDPLNPDCPLSHINSISSTIANLY